MSKAVDSNSNTIFGGFLPTTKTFAKAVAILACATAITTGLHFLNKKFVWIDMSTMQKKAEILMYTGVGSISFQFTYVTGLCLQNLSIVSNSNKPTAEVDRIFNQHDKVYVEEENCDGITKIYRLNDSEHQVPFTLGTPGELQPSKIFNFATRSRIARCLAKNHFLLMLGSSNSQAGICISFYNKAKENTHITSFTLPITQEDLRLRLKKLGIQEPVQWIPYEPTS